MDTGAVDSPYPLYSGWYSVHVGSASRGRCPRWVASPPVSGFRVPQKERRLRGGLLPLVLQSRWRHRETRCLVQFSQKKLVSMMR
jgi:hypothetical protein